MATISVPAGKRQGFWPTVWDWITTVDHKKIGVMYLIAVLIFFFIGGVLALAVRTELLEPVRTVGGQITGQFFKSDEGMGAGNTIYNRLFTLHGAVMVFMVIIPSVPAALGNFLLPLMLGAKDVAFPRPNLLSWYIYFFGSLFAGLSIYFGGVDTGWTFYTPYSTTTDPDQSRVILMVLGAFIMGFSSILTGLNFIVTVHKLRAPGMGDAPLPDPHLAIVNDEGAQLAADDDGGPGLDARLRFTPENSSEFVLQDRAGLPARLAAIRSRSLADSARGRMRERRRRTRAPPTAATGTSAFASARAAATASRRAPAPPPRRATARTTTATA